MKMIPDNTPQMALEKVRLRLRENSLAEEKVVLVGLRGYYRDSMGVPGKNDRGIYDDAIFIVSPRHFSSWNANVDPSVFRPGIATLACGIHPYRRGNHGISRKGGGYPAFRPATKNEELPVVRDGVLVDPRPGVAINIHRGGRNSTSSEGCQTLPPTQWNAFYAALDGELKCYKQLNFFYLLEKA